MEARTRRNTSSRQRGKIQTPVSGNGPIKRGHVLVAPLHVDYTAGEGLTASKSSRTACCICLYAAVREGRGYSTDFFGAFPPSLLGRRVLLHRLLQLSEWCATFFSRLLVGKADQSLFVCVFGASSGGWCGRSITVKIVHSTAALYESVKLIPGRYPFSKPLLGVSVRRAAARSCFG